MRVMSLTFVLMMISFPIYSEAQDDAPPEGFLDNAEIRNLLKFEKFDDLHSLEDSDGKRIKPLEDNIPFLAETYDQGIYKHYNDEGVTDSGEYFVKDHALCITWTWTNEEKFEVLNGTKDCFYIEQRGNCYLPQRKSRFALPDKKIYRSTHIFLKYGADPQCQAKLS